jgi:predicted lipoprotein with Yx(FWY)xxD motif
MPRTFSNGKVRGVAVSMGRDDTHVPEHPTFGGTMKRTYVFLAVAFASAASAATVASAQTGLAAAHSSRAVTVQLRHTSLGSILVSGSGSTLYEFTRDHASKNSCAAISGCSAIWPSLKASGRPTAGSGAEASLLSTTSGNQVTYAGHPLYTYSGDSGPGKTSYVGVKQFGGTWYAINVSGDAVK